MEDILIQTTTLTQQVKDTEFFRNDDSNKEQEVQLPRLWFKKQENSCEKSITSQKSNKIGENLGLPVCLDSWFSPCNSVDCWSVP